MPYICHISPSALVIGAVAGLPVPSVRVKSVACVPPCFEHMHIVASSYLKASQDRRTNVDIACVEDA